MIDREKSKMKFLPCAFLIIVATAQAAPAQSSAPHLTLVTDPRDRADRLIAVCTVQDFGAVGDGQTDDTGAFAKALHYASKLGGGTVYAPAGKYAIKGTLVILKSVYLAGEWANPNTQPDKIGQGTVLYAYTGKNDPGQPSFITVSGSAGVIGLTIYYPEQSITSPTPYPWTVELNDHYDGHTTGYATVQDVTLVNSYDGVSDGRHGIQLQVIDGLYGSPIHRGIFIRESWDVPKIQNVSFAAKYWKQYDASNPASGQIASVMKANLTGLAFGHDTWNFIYNLSIADCKVGILFDREIMPKVGMSFGDGQMDLVTITNAVTGIEGIYGYGGTAMARTRITADGSPGSCCVKLQVPFDSAIQFIDSTFSNPGGPCIVVEKGVPGVLAVQNSTFETWEENDCAIRLAGGSMTARQNAFHGAGKAIVVDATARAAAIDKNLYASSVVTPVTDNKKDATVWVNTDPNFTRETNPSYEVDLGVPPKVTGQKLVSVADFGAVKDGKTDSTDAFTKAIQSVASAGGGIVYVPGGMYLLNGTLTIPTGVELRGVSEAGHHTSGGGSVLLTTAGENAEGGTPFLSLETGSILRGVTIWHPQQDYEKIKPYPWAIRVLGKNVSIRYVVLGNAYRGIDMGTFDSGGHYVDSVGGTTFFRTLWLDKSSSKGVIKNLHFNPHFILGTQRTGLPGGIDFLKTPYKLLEAAIFHFLDAHNVFLTIGKTTSETLFSDFNYRANVGLKLTGGFDGILHGIGLDGTVADMSITGEQKKPIVLVNGIFDLVPGKNELGNGHLFIATSNEADVTILNSKFGAWNFVPKDEVATSNAKLTLKSDYFMVTATNGAVNVKSGTALLLGNIFGHLGRLNAADAVGFYTNQPATVTDLVFAPDASAQAFDNIGKGSFHTTPADQPSSGNVAAARDADR